MTKLVRDLMHPGLLTCRPDATLGELAVLLTQHHVHAILVTDRHGRPLGLLSDYDLLAGEWLSEDPESMKTMSKITAAELMSTPVDSVEVGMPLSEAAHILNEKERNRLLVTDKGKAVGVISISDFVASIAREEKHSHGIVSEVMSDAILVCRDKTPLTSAARTMTEARWRSVLVVNAEGKPEGVVSGKDLMPFVEKGVDEKLTVHDVMHKALTIDLNASLREAADIMIKTHHHRLVVLDTKNPEHFPLGIISSFDIVAAMARPGSIWQS